MGEAHGVHLCFTAAVPNGGFIRAPGAQSTRRAVELCQLLRAKQAGVCHLAVRHNFWVGLFERDSEAKRADKVAKQVRCGSISLQGSNSASRMGDLLGRPPEFGVPNGGFIRAPPGNSASRMGDLLGRPPPHPPKVIRVPRVGVALCELASHQRSAVRSRERSELSRAERSEAAWWPRTPRLGVFVGACNCPGGPKRRGRAGEGRQNCPICLVGWDFWGVEGGCGGVWRRWLVARATLHLARALIAD